MAATYDPSLFGPIDRLRFAVGDTNVAAALLPDETYESLLLGNTNDEQRAIVAAASALLVRYAQEPDRVDLDGVGSAQWSKRLAGWGEIVRNGRTDITLAEQRQKAQLLRGRFLRPSRSEEHSTEYDGHHCGRVPW